MSDEIDRWIEAGARAASASSAWPAVYQAGTARVLARAVGRAMIPLALREALTAVEAFRLASEGERERAEAARDEAGAIEAAARLEAAVAIRDAIVEVGNRAEDGLSEQRR